MRLHVGIFSESYTPVVNGVSVSIETLTRELEKRGHRVSIFAPSFAGYRDSRPDVYRFASLRTRAMPDYPIAWPPGYSLFERFGRLKLDIIHTHTPFIVGTAGLGWAEATNVPIVSTNHTHYSEYVHYFKGPRAFWRAIVVGWMRMYYNRCAAVIVPSENTGLRLESYGIKTPWRAIPTGIQLETGKDTVMNPRERFAIDKSDRLLVFVGRIAREKNLDLLLEAFQRIQAAIPVARLMIVGGGPNLDDYKQLAQMSGLANRVTFTGPIPRNQLSCVLNDAELFVFPSLTETQGLAVGEAAFCGVPAVAVRSGGIPEFIRDGQTGYLVNNSVEEFAGRVLELMQDEVKRKSFSDEAKRFAQALSVDAMTDKILGVYDMAIRRSRC